MYAPGGSWGNDYRVVWVDREGRTEPLIETPRAYVVARLSPDGRAVALGIDDANASVWVHDLARGTQTRLASGYNNLGPIWTPRGDRATFRRNHPTGVDLRWRPADGSDDAETLSSSEQQQSPGSWTSDGTTLLFHGRRPESGDDILTLSLDDDRTVSELVNTESNERSPMISPNDRWLAYESDESGRWEVYVQAFPDATRKVQVSTDGGVRPRWNPNGQELFYRQGDKLMAVEIETEGALELDTPRALFERFFDDYDVGPLGERFIMVDTSVARAAPRKLVLVQNWSEELKRLVPTEE